MFRAAMFAVLAVALSSSPAFAQQLGEGSIYPVANAVIENTQVMAVAAASSTTIVIPADPILPAASVSGLTGFAEPIVPETVSITAPSAPKWATMLAIAGPLADGLSTMYAMRQSGPHARVAEGNGFYGKLFGSNVKGYEIMAFKVAQAAFFGYSTHVGGRKNMERAIGSAIMQSAINFWVTSRNMKNAAKARSLNGR